MGTSIVKRSRGATRTVLLLFYDVPWGLSLDVPSTPDITISTDRNRYDDADAVVFHPPEWTRARIRARRPWAWDLHPAKRPGQLWIASTIECQDHYPIMRDVRFMRHFDLTMTYRRDCDVPATYAIPHGSVPAMIAALRRPPPPKSADALLATFISSAVDTSNRRAYLYELAQYMAIDSYGTFMNNRALASDAGRPSKLDAISTYRFTAAFENARAVDYVTEKFFDPLWAGSIPVYFGAPNVAAFAPGDHCYIDASDFPDPRQLAEHLRAIAGDDERYGRFFDWKQRPLRDSFLKLIETESRSPVERLCALLRQRFRRP
ncbi:glycosyltransferase family 10 domain-containing protein [Reyranella sp. CPCC 100927]|uniref:glycosyltransferase family 10 domain-containing protein n=1 Tax=Reyranella sp. CPCC 100927 TaxID=2599616 RepID=UPI0011B5054A|nr:glycosyltransferase family 10 [Reyranella sp. CPCC 100927]TWS95117.1 alpha-1,3-fucosyltransferase [Reyranella sp. CPCC 100927]